MNARMRHTAALYQTDLERHCFTWTAQRRTPGGDRGAIGTVGRLRVWLARQARPSARPTVSEATAR